MLLTHNITLTIHSIKIMSDWVKYLLQVGKVEEKKRYIGYIEALKAGLKI